MDELEELGYLRRSRVQEHNADGGFGHTHYVFYDTPQEEGAPCTRFMYTDNPYTENQPQEKNQLETNQLDSPQKPPRGRREKTKPNYEPEMFERFWKAYPRGEDRQGAVREWDKLKPDRQLMHKMSTALARQKATLSLPDDHDHYAFQYAVRWLRYRRWEDDIEKSAASASRRGAAPSYEPEVSAWQ